ncbi:MAG: methyltransferase domain-containing protein [Candidatus Krumholzibacteria bacterium]|nr:methyltransferase domain-containing protein [Candidatus Krumholzibacteria bacterium]
MRPDDSSYSYDRRDCSGPADHAGDRQREACRRALERLAERPRPPRPWRDGRQLPWHEPDFSRRVLPVHHDPRTHMASRAPAVIAEHVAWLRELLTAEPQPNGRARHLLDLGCGPGLYALPLARAGLRITGIDFSPAALTYARQLFADDGLDTAVFIEADLTALPADIADRLAPVDTVTFWFGEFASFPPATALSLLQRLAPAVVPDGLLILEYQSLELFPCEDGSSWEVGADNVFADGPHLWLQEWAWDADARAEITVHWIFDPVSGRLDRYAQSHQAYSDEELVALLAQAGFDRVSFYPPITGCDERFEFPLLVARKRG